MTWASDSELETAIELYNRCARLLNNIRRFPRDSMHRRDRSLARHYNDLRRDVVRFIADRHLTQLIPGPVWCLEMWHVVLGMVMLGALIGIARLSSSEDAKTVSLIAIMVIASALFAGLLFRMPWERTDPWYWRASPVNTVAERTTRLSGFLGDYLEEKSPGITTNSVNNAGGSWDVESEEIASYSGGRLAKRPVELTETERAHLETQLQERQKRYDLLTDRIAAIVNDLRVEMDGERKLTLRARLQELTEEREGVQTLLKTIERALDECRAIE
jgi:hypothetical protein